MRTDKRIAQIHHLLIYIIVLRIEMEMSHTTNRHCNVNGKSENDFVVHSYTTQKLHS